MRILSWLGFVYDLVNRMVYAEKHKLDKTLDLLRTIRSKRSVHMRQMASLAGSIIALQPAVGDGCLFKIKADPRGHSNGK